MIASPVLDLDDVALTKADDIALALEDDIVSGRIEAGS